MRFRARQVADPLAQQNFEQLEGLVTTDEAAARLAPLTVGPIAGNGGSVSGSDLWIALPGLAKTFTTPSYPTRARIDHQIRIGTTTAAWNFAYAGLTITPTPVSRLHANAVVGAAAGAQAGTALNWVHSAGTASVHLVGWDTADLAPKTTYTVQACAAGSGAAGALIWQTSVENTLMVTLSPR